MTHLPFIIASYMIALGIIIFFTLQTTFRLKRDKQIIAQFSSRREK